MKRARLSALLLAASVICAGPMAMAQNPKAPEGLQKEFDAFMVQFRAALKTGSGEAVADLTRFPFQGDANQTRAVFLKENYPQLFKPKARACLARAKAIYDRSPSGEETFISFCNDMLYQFSKTPQGFRFADSNPDD